MTLFPQMVNIPNRFSLVSGSSEGFSTLNAFDGALLQAGIGNTNLVKMSSILPPYCKQVQLNSFAYGSLVPVAYATKSSSQPCEVISAAVSIGIPKNKELPGVIMEYSANNLYQKETERHVEQMAISALKMRSWELEEVLTVGIEHRVKKNGSVFAAVVLSYAIEEE